MGIVKSGSKMNEFMTIKTFHVTCDECGHKSPTMGLDELSRFMCNGWWHTRENRNTYCGECVDKILDWHEMENNI